MFDNLNTLSRRNSAIKANAATTKKLRMIIFKIIIIKEFNILITNLSMGCQAYNPEFHTFHKLSCGHFRRIGVVWLRGPLFC